MLNRLAGSAKKAWVKGWLVLLQAVLFNPLALRGWVRLLKHRVEFFGTSHWIGTMVIIDYYLKRKRARRSTVLSVYLINKPHLANRYLARFQAKALSDARTIFVMNRFLCRLLAPLERQLFFAGPTASFVQHPQDYHELNARYPLHLEEAVPASERRRARAAMARLGLPREARFVCVHAREAGFKARLQPSGHNTYRDIDIANYLPAIEWLTREGFWVVRMGEATVKPLPAMARVIDYARSPLKSEDLDVLLMAGCECLLGCNSGFSQLAHLFNKRALWTNSIPLEMCPWDGLALWIPKLIFSQAEGRDLTFPEIISRGIGQYHRTQEYEAAALVPRENTPDDILAATRELLGWSRGEPGYSAEDRQAQARFAALFPPQYKAYGTRSRICASFMRAHADLMPMVDDGMELTAAQHPLGGAS